MTFIGTNLDIPSPLGAFFIPVNDSSGLETLYGYALPKLWYDYISYNIRTMPDMLFFVQQKNKDLCAKSTLFYMYVQVDWNT